jgi:hypothetical protein
VSIHHKPIKCFKLDGNIKDESNIYRLKEEYIRLLIVQMKESAYVPRIDIEPDFTVYYNESKDWFEFKLTVYGIYVGKKNIEWMIAADGYNPIYTQKIKLKEFSSALESQYNQK